MWPSAVAAIVLALVPAALALARSRRAAAFA